ncbi:MAG: HNH endonuclease, partial [Parcubacteria group bacterium]|nr:HNH endonuclease [Parcubacteria group bacterium]
MIQQSGGGKKCAVCGKNNLKIAAAHIEPLEVGGVTTEENIILLCSKSINSDAPGCHELFDDGLSSIKQIEKLKNSKCLCECGAIRNQMMKLWEKRKNEQNSLQQLISKRHWGIALKLLKKQNNNIQNEKQFRIIIQEAEINRKRTAKDGLKKAKNILNFISNSIQSVPVELHSQFYYESGYVHLLRGEHALALKQFEMSEGCATNNIEKTASFWLWLNAEIALSGNQSRWDIIEKKMDKIDRNTNQDKTILSNRIHANGLFNRVRVFLIQKEFEKAKDKLCEAVEHWKKMDYKTGWEKSFFPTILSLRGQVLLSLNDTKCGAKTALELFSRYI